MDTLFVSDMRQVNCKNAVSTAAMMLEVSKLETQSGQWLKKLRSSVKFLQTHLMSFYHITLRMFWRISGDSTAVPGDFM
jgi:hypothetical protein